jgi:hypothetical protein
MIGFCVIGLAMGTTMQLVQSAAKFVVKRSIRLCKNANGKSPCSEEEAEEAEAEEAEEAEEDDVPDGKWEKLWLLLLYTLLLALYICWMVVVFEEREHWERMDALYWALITTTTIGFGDFAPELTKWWPSTHAFIIGGLLIMGLWLELSGAAFFEVATWLWVTMRRGLIGKTRAATLELEEAKALALSGPSRLLHTPMHAISSALKNVPLNKANQRRQLVQGEEGVVVGREEGMKLTGAATGVTGVLHTDFQQIRGNVEEFGHKIEQEWGHIVHEVCSNKDSWVGQLRTVLAPWAVLVFVMIVASIKLEQYELPSARESSAVYWVAYNKIIEDLLLAPDEMNAGNSR